MFEEATGLIVNIAIWDGESLWDPGEGLDCVALNDSPADIGWTYKDGVFTPPTE
jgi:hypothetical protein